MDSRDIHMNNISPYIHSKPVYYMSDGTGRDSYIVRSSGGLFEEYKPGSTKNSFYTTLRQYETGKASYDQRRRSLSPSIKEKSDVFLRSQGHFNSTALANIKKMKTYQRMLDKRLSVPKHAVKKSNL